MRASYKVVSKTATTITIWPVGTWDQDHPTERAGMMTVTLPDTSDFNVEDTVYLSVIPGFLIKPAEAPQTPANPIGGV